MLIVQIGLYSQPKENYNVCGCVKGDKEEIILHFILHFSYGMPQIL